MQSMSASDVCFASAELLLFDECDEKLMSFCAKELDKRTQDLVQKTTADGGRFVEGVGSRCALGELYKEWISEELRDLRFQQVLLV